MSSTISPSPYTGASMFDTFRSRVRWNLPVDELVREAVRRGEGELTPDGALVVRTGKFTGRSPQDKFTVRREPSAAHVDWSSRFNLPLEPEPAERMTARAVASALRLPTLYGFQGFIGRGSHRVPVALVTEYAWHALMGRHMYVRPTEAELAALQPEFTLLYTPSFRADPQTDGTASDTVVLCDLERKLGVIGGTFYGGEEKKFFFYLMNYLMPLEGVFPMHCSANIGRQGDVSVIFGLSGTGKTTLSADPDRSLLGDDEHGWGPEGVFNFEGGCYAKLIRLSRSGEPLIWNAVNRPGSIMENVTLTNGHPDFEDGTIENTRGVYPLDVLPNVDEDGFGGHPNTVVFLTFDASGTLPPVSVLDECQALYWFLAGYTAKVAGTERGLGSRPEPTFSACFGAPFLPWHPRKYVELFRDYLRRHQPTVVLMNTGSIGGPYGEGGRRPPLDATRELLRLAQTGALREVELREHPEYGFRVPQQCGSVPRELLNPAESWSDGGRTYQEAARELIAAFHQRVNERYAGEIDREILEAGPRKG
ncbi:MAG: phosphoenolpyruvate carboxykinase (ATP) [Armatimonadota bacterium]